MGDSGTVPIPFRCFKGFANFASTAFSEVGAWESAEAYGVSFGVPRPTIMSRRD
jgi:hypothetical protein